MRITKLAACLATLSSPLMAADLENPNHTNMPVTALDAVTVTATRTAKSALNSAQAVNVINAEQIEQVLASSVFDSLISIPNVTATGGPRNMGQKFNVRGFSDAEDVLISVDGAIQTFEKYRMGSFFSDPELYRSVNVKRGPSTVLHGGGALGGVVEMELKDASDFLAPGEQGGVKVKLGHHGNNNENNGTVYAYARPTDSLDILTSYVKRSSDDFKLSNGETLDNSGIEAESLLLKAEYYLNEDSLIGLSYTKSEDNQRTEFNTTDPGAWGTVYREIEQSVTNLSYELNPANNPYVNLTARLGRTQSQVVESDGSGTLKDFIGLESNYEYNITTLDIANTSLIKQHALTYGMQYSEKDRVGTKLSYPCLNLDMQTYQCIDYAEQAIQNEITSQPGGTQKRIGVYLQDEFTWQALTLTTGLRYEKYKTTATSSFANSFNNLDTDVDHSQVVPALTAHYQINNQLAVFSSYQQGFRAPLIDELYDQYGGRDPALELKVENSTNKEIGASYQNQNIFTNRDALTAHVIYFKVKIDDEIQSNTNIATNPEPAARYNNSGENQRDGIEFEINYAHTLGYANFSYSRISGENQNNEPLWYLPADKFALSSGLNFFNDVLKTGFNIQHVNDRTVLVAGIEQQHKSYVLAGINASWDINDSWNARLAIDNLFDKEYQVIAGTTGAIGDYGVGRNIKTQISFKF